jgi:hypothetical protein
MASSSSASSVISFES